MHIWDSLINMSRMTIENIRLYSESWRAEMNHGDPDYRSAMLLYNLRLNLNP